MQTALFFWGFCCGLYCMMKSWALCLTHSTCKYGLYIQSIFLFFCFRPRRVRLGFICRPPLLFFLFQGFIYRPYYACLLGSWEMFVTHSPISAIQVLFLNAKHRRLFRFMEDGEYWARVTTAGFNKQNELRLIRLRCRNMLSTDLQQ